MSLAQIATTSRLPKMELIPPRDAEVEGVFRSPGSDHNNSIIYTEVVLDREAMKANKRPRLDKDGNEIWKRHPTTGEKIYQMMQMDTIFKTDRYILVGGEVARKVKKVRNFEPTSEELQALEQKDAERNFLEEFVAAAAASGMSAAEVVAKIKRDTLGEGVPEDQVEIDVTEEVVAEAMANVSEVIERDETEEGFEPIQKPKRRGKKA